MSKNYEFVGQDVLLTKTTGAGHRDSEIGIRLSCVTRWQPYGGDPNRTKVWLNDGGEVVVVVPFGDFTKIIGMPIATSLED